MYNCEVWTILTNKKLEDKNLITSSDKAIFETLNLNMCKYLLGVRKNASNLASRGEIGRYPLLLDFLRHSYNFRDRISQMDGSLVKDAFMESSNLGPSSWANLLKDLPAKLSCFNSDSSLNVAKLHQLYSNCWLKSLNDSEKLDTLASVKHEFKLEKYVISLPKHLRKDLAKLRTSSHPLEVEVGRYHRPYVERNKRLCKICNNGEVEDEHHFLTSCSFYKAEKRDILSQLETHNLNLTHLFNTVFGMNQDNPILIRISCLFVKSISEKRSEYSRSNPDTSRFTPTVTRYGRVSRPPQRLMMEITYHLSTISTINVFHFKEQQMY